MLMKQQKTRIDDIKVIEEVLPEEQLIVVLTGKS